MNRASLKAALLAAVSLTAATGAVAATPPTEAAPMEHAVGVADRGAGEKVAIGAAATVAGLAGLLSFRRIRAALRRLAPAVGKAAKKAAETSIEAARTVARAVASPFRLALFVIGVGTAAVISAGVFDVDWLAGLIVGALLTASILLGARRARKALRAR